MKAARPLVVVLLVCALALASACGDRSPTTPQSPAPSADLIGSALSTTSSLLGGLLKCRDLPYDSSTVTIGSAGGTISVGPHTLSIPPGALKKATTITMILPTGLGVNAVKLKPEGLQFQTPAYLQMSYANCSLQNKLLPKRIAYTTDNLQILSYLLSIDNLLSKYVTGQVPHFSDYVIAW